MDVFISDVITACHVTDLLQYLCFHYFEVPFIVFVSIEGNGVTTLRSILYLRRKLIIKDISFEMLICPIALACEVVS